MNISVRPVVLLNTLIYVHQVDHRLAIEKLILDIDGKLSYTMIKGASTSDNIQYEVLQRMNEISEDHKLKHKWISRWQLSNPRSNNMIRSRKF